MLNHVLFLYLLFVSQEFYFLVYSFVTYYLIFLIGINISAHRYFSHKGFALNKNLEKLFAFIMCICTVGSPIAWAGMHRKHHQFSDGGNDPHSPRSEHKNSYLRSYIGIWKQYTADLKYVRDLRKESIQKIFHKNYFLVIILYCLLIYCIRLSPTDVIVFYCIPAVFCFHAASLIVTLGHSAKTKDVRTNDYSVDSIIIHYLCAGEGLHNLHHQNPKTFYFRENKWYFFDFPGFIISKIKC